MRTWMQYTRIKSEVKRINPLGYVLQRRSIDIVGIRIQCIRDYDRTETVDEETILQMVQNSPPRQSAQGR